ncbi:MAG: rhomboid family intramembrane serine protease, partial [Flavobacteriaceae bacterium]|nr:rhomboid family intramembrane serine protease [Flavobacteriaceae bacterium]
VYANKLKEGKDIGRSFETIFSQLFKVFTRSKTPLKTAYKISKSTPSQGVTTAYKEREQQKKTDAILDKISHSGYDSLTKEEKDYLFSSGKS